MLSERRGPAYPNIVGNRSSCFGMILILYRRAMGFFIPDKVVLFLEIRVLVKDMS